MIALFLFHQAAATSTVPAETIAEATDMSKQSCYEEEDEWVDVTSPEASGGSPLAPLAPLTPRESAPGTTITEELVMASSLNSHVAPVGGPAVADAVTFTLNGKSVKIKSPDPTQSLLDYLRYDVGLTGTKGSCRQGGCGACTVLMNGLGINACLRPLVACDGMTV